MGSKINDTRREDDAELWTKFLATRDPALRESLILRYVPLVHFVLHRLGMSPSIGPDYEDLASQGLLGLIDAVDRYDPGHGTQFSTYATLRVRGHVLDQLRASDWLSRSARRRTREVQNAITTLWGQFQRAPTDEELATHLNLELGKLRQALVEADHVILSLDSDSDADSEEVSLHELLADDEHPENADPSEAWSKRDRRAMLAEMIKSLPEREQLILSLYYYEELTLKEIGKVLDLSESRVCQLHARAMLSLRAQLKSETAEGEIALI
jgi:RNA polymerase sigma factor FliA